MNDGRTHREGVFANSATGDSKNIRRVELLEHGFSLAGVDDVEYLMVSGKWPNA